MNRNCAVATRRSAATGSGATAAIPARMADGSASDVIEVLDGSGGADGDVNPCVGATCLTEQHCEVANGCATSANPLQADA